MRGRRSPAWVVTLVIAACTSTAPHGAPDTRPPGTPLAGGLVVARGTRLVGAVFSTPDGIGGFQSIAVLDIHHDPVAAYDAYATQVRRLGGDMPMSGATVTYSGTPFGTCSGALRDRDAPLDDTSPAETRWVHCTAGSEVPTSGFVRVDTAWGGPSHHAVVTVQPPRTAPPTLGPSSVTYDSGTRTRRARRFRPLPRVTDRSSLSRVGATFGEENNAFESGGGHFRLVAGSRLVADVAHTTDQIVVVLRVDGDARRIMTAYARQLGRGGRTAPVRRVRTPAGWILQTGSGPIGGGGADLVTDPSGHWILLRANSD